MHQSKRNLTKVLGATTVAFAAWQKPVIQSIALPAHAQTSALTCSAQNLCDFSPDRGNEMDIFVVSFDGQTCGFTLVDTTDDYETVGDFVVAVNIEDSPVAWTLTDYGGGNWDVIVEPAAGTNDIATDGTQTMTIERVNTGDIGAQFIVNITVSNLQGTNDSVGCADVTVNFSESS